MGTGLPREFLLTAAVLSEPETISPGFAVPEASTTSLVLPADGGLNGTGPDEEPACSQGFGGGLFPATKICTQPKYQKFLAPYFAYINKKEPF